MEKNCGARGVNILFWKKKCFDFEIGFEGDQRVSLGEEEEGIPCTGAEDRKGTETIRGESG